MRRQTERLRLQVSSWYTGSGNKISNFTRRPNKPFEAIKAVYGEEIERLNRKNPDRTLTFETLSDEEKLIIRNNVKGEMRRERNKVIIASSVAVILLTLSVLAITKLAIKYL